MKKRLYLFIFLIFLTPFTLASIETGLQSNDGIGVNLIPIEPTFNNNTANVNNSNFLQGLTPQQVADLFNEVDDVVEGRNNVFTGDNNFTGDVHIRNNAKSIWFGANDDADIYFDGDSLNIIANENTLSDDLSIGADNIQLSTSGDLWLKKDLDVSGFLEVNNSYYVRDDMEFDAGNFGTFGDVSGSRLLLGQGSNSRIELIRSDISALFGQPAGIAYVDFEFFTIGKLFGDGGPPYTAAGGIYIRQENTAGLSGYNAIAVLGTDGLVLGSGSDDLSDPTVGRSISVYGGGSHQDFGVSINLEGGETVHQMFLGNTNLGQANFTMNNGCIILEDGTSICDYSSISVEGLYRPINHPTELDSSNVTGILTVGKGGTGTDISGFANNSIIYYNSDKGSFERTSIGTNSVLIAGDYGVPQWNSAKYTEWNNKYGEGMSIKVYDINSTNGIWNGGTITTTDDLIAGDDLFVGDQLYIGEYTKGVNYAEFIRAGYTGSGDGGWGNSPIILNLFDTQAMRSDTETKGFLLYLNGTGNASSGASYGAIIQNDMDYIGGGSKVGIDVRMGGTHNKQEIALSLDSNNQSILARGQIHEGRDPYTPSVFLPEYQGIYAENGIETTNMWTRGLIQSYQFALADPIWAFISNKSASNDRPITFYLDSYSIGNEQLYFSKNFSIMGNQRSLPSSDLRWNGDTKSDLLYVDSSEDRVFVYDLNVSTGFTGTCINVTYSGGIAISCND